MQIDDNKKRILIINFAAIIFISVAMLIYCAIVLNAHIDTVYEKFEINQREENVIISTLFEDMIKRGCTNEDIYYYARDNVSFSGKKYLYIFVSDYVLFAQNEYISSQFMNKSKDAFLASISRNGATITTSQTFYYGENDYVVGIIADKDSIINEVGKDKLIFMILIVIFVVAVAFSSYALWILIQNAVLKQRFEKADAELKMRVDSFEEFLNDYEDIRMKYENVSSELSKVSNRFFDIKVVQKLLERSDRDEYNPLSIIIVRFILNDRYFTKSEIDIFTKKITLAIPKDAVFAEITIIKSLRSCNCSAVSAYRCQKSIF